VSLKRGLEAKTDWLTVSRNMILADYQKQALYTVLCWNTSAFVLYVPRLCSQWHMTRLSSQPIGKVKLGVAQNSYINVFEQDVK
jgi:hypothetical protein